jgi:hypothetical protein
LKVVLNTINKPTITVLSKDVMLKLVNI